MSTRAPASMAQVEITAMTFGPYGVGRLDGKAVMVPHAAPGDLLEVTVVRERAGYLVARAERVLKAGAARRTPPCPYLPRCGGCDWQQIAYPEQARFKAEVIAATLNHALGLELDPTTLIEPAAGRVRLPRAHQVPDRTRRAAGIL